MFNLGTSFEDGGRMGLESKMMAQFLHSQKDHVVRFAETQDEEYQEKTKQFYNTESFKDYSSNSFFVEHEEDIKSILERYNRLSRLTQQNTDEFVPQLREMEKQYKLGLLPPPMPSEYLNESIWLEDESKWIGHGYYWKSGNQPMCKDLSFCDYDSLEDNFYPLTTGSVLVADYELLKKDFPCLKDFSQKQIDDWMISQAAFISEGQIKRCREGGDMYELIEDITGKFDESQSKIGVRMKGGGRACTFIINNEYCWNEKGNFTADMVEVKGIGTTILQPEIEKKACGFLSYVDALKEFAYQKLIHHISELENQEWNTVQYYAIIDTGIKYKENEANPATGYKGDRCVLCLRQRQSRIISCYDEIVYYSVVRRELLSHGIGKAFCNSLAKYGISSEQIPSKLFAPEDDNNLSGDWNVQSDATLTHIVDFSHFFVLPSSSLNDKWKLSTKDVEEALLLGAEHFELFKNENLRKLIQISDQSEESIREYYSREIPLLEKKYSEFGSIGQRKPSYSWSWFLEVDNSWIMKWALKKGTSKDVDEDNSILEIIQKCL